MFQASRDGFSTASFHSKCDGKYMHTLVVAKTSTNSTQQFIFGGYTESDWSGYGRYDSNAFIFSLINAYNKSVKMNVLKPEHAILSAPQYGPCFQDLSIHFDVGFSNLGDSYSVPSFIPNTTYDYQTFLAGSRWFTPVEVEVYAIYIDRKNISKIIITYINY